jgi:hypothetical protein
MVVSYFPVGAPETASGCCTQFTNASFPQTRAVFDRKRRPWNQTRRSTALFDTPVRDVQQTTARRVDVAVADCDS